MMKYDSSRKVLLGRKLQSSGNVFKNQNEQIFEKLFL